MYGFNCRFFSLPDVVGQTHQSVIVAAAALIDAKA